MGHRFDRMVDRNRCRFQYSYDHIGSRNTKTARNFRTQVSGPKRARCAFQFASGQDVGVQIATNHCSSQA